jgi:2-amino-4-hydroxy-6-hydroxymethyldihydropteridine diphosphokinase
LHDEAGAFVCSGIYLTEPVDCPPGSPPFLNAAVELSCRLPVEEILARTQAIEIGSGRPADHEFHAPRTIDLDLLYHGDKEIKTPRLVLPHPRIGERLFVLAPLADICPSRILPCCPAGVAARLLELQGSQKIERIPDLLHSIPHGNHAPSASGRTSA